MTTATTKHTQHSNIIEVSNLRLKFPGAASLLFKDLSFTAHEGEKVLFLGPSGCGKSTLLQVLSGLIPHSTEVPIKHDNIQLPETYGFVFQDPDTQFCMPYVDEELAFVLENLQVPRQDMDAKIKDVLQSVGLDAVSPHTLIQSLSQGMKQRLALASVLLLDPDVIFLDEPSALLDPEGTIQIWNAVKAVAANKTVIIVEHKIDHIADWVDRVILFNHDGKMIADHPPEQIFKQFKHELIEYGIWYPGVWQDYIASETFRSLMARRINKQQSVDENKPLVELSEFKGYHGKQEKIHVKDATIDKKSWITIVGDNGAGKSTLLLALMRLIHATGHYHINGRLIDMTDKKKTPPKELSLVFQNPELQFVTHTVFDEIAFSLQLQKLSSKAIKQEVARLLCTFQLHVEDDHHPYQLSIGQKRRLSVATAFAHHSNILILDEPTFGQDAQNTFMMLEQLEYLRQQGTTIVMVTHDMHIVEHFATEVWTIEQGQLTAITQPEKQTPFYREADQNESTRLIHTP